MAEDAALRDQLAIDRTRLANERTMLAWVRTALALVGGGVAIIHFYPTGWQAVGGGVSVGFGAVTLIVGLRRSWVEHTRLNGLK